MSINFGKFTRHGRRSLAVVVLLALVLGAVAFRLTRTTPVDVHAVAAGEIQGEIMGTGTLAARVSAVISPKIQGRLVELLADQNDTVHVGQLLARLDDGDLQQQVEIASATLASARATVDRVRADQARAEAVVNLTRLDHLRSTELLATKTVAQADFDKSLQALRVAEADLQRTQLAIIESEHQVVTAEKTLLYHQERLGDTHLTSPLDGLVVKRHRDPGEIVVPGTSIMELVATRELWVAAWVDETALAGLATGLKARVIFRSEPQNEYTGEVARIGRQTDPETRELLVEVRVDTLPGNWTIGQRAEVYIATQRSAATAIVPTGFLQVRDGQPGVYVRAGNKARWRTVRTGVRGREFVEIKEGLAAGEQILAARSAGVSLHDGDRIAAP